MQKRSMGWMSGLAALALVGGLAMPSMLLGQANRPADSVGDDSAVTLRLSLYEGFTEPAKQALMGAPLDGILMELPVVEGQPVALGDTLAVMDDRVQRVAVEIARLESESVAAIDAAQAGLDEATVEWENQVALEQRGSATERDVRRALAAQKQAEAELLRARENIAIAAEQYKLEQAQLERYTLRALFPGVVQVIDTAEGAALRLNDPILMLVNNESLRATINLPEYLQHDERMAVNRVYRLQRLELRGTQRRVVDELQGKLINIDEGIDRGSQTLRLTFEIENPGAPGERMPAGFLFRVASLEAVESP